MLLKGGTLVHLHPPATGARRPAHRRRHHRRAGGQAHAEAGRGRRGLPGAADPAGLRVRAHAHVLGALAGHAGAGGAAEVVPGHAPTASGGGSTRRSPTKSIYYSAMVGAVEAVTAGTTTIVDHHASPNAIPGSLDIIREALGVVGVRGVLCYEVTDRGGLRRRDAGLAENDRFLTRDPRRHAVPGPCRRPRVVHAPRRRASPRWATWRGTIGPASTSTSAEATDDEERTRRAARGRHHRSARAARPAERPRGARARRAPRRRGTSRA